MIVVTSGIVLLACVTARFATMVGSASFFPCPRPLPRANKVMIGFSLLCQLAEVTSIYHGHASFRQAFVACAAYIASLAIFVSAVWVSRHAPPPAMFCDAEEPELIREGPYRWVRHPFYTAQLLAYAGGIVGSQNRWLVIPLFVNVVIFAMTALVEEHHFGAGLLGPQYLAYRSQTGMFLPSPLRLLRELSRRQACPTPPPPQSYLSETSNA